MKIAYVSAFDPISKSSWSGCSYFLAKALDKASSTELEFVGPLHSPKSPVLAGKKLYYRARKINYLSTVDPRTLKYYSAQVSAAIEDINPDVVISLGALPIAFLQTNLPLIYFWDCTFLGNLEYPWFSRLSSESIRNGHLMEQLALNNCSLAVYSSEWAVRTALDGYKIDLKKLRIAPLGANLTSSRTIDDISRSISARKKDECRLLFLGIDWFRKGGDVAYAVAKELNSRGLPTTLTIVGCEPKISEPLPEFVKPLGFISKSNESGVKKINELLETSHFLIVPSKAESFGAVFCEASSFGTPSLATRTGGIPDAVRDGLNGQLFSTDASVHEYCDFVLKMFFNFSEYKSLALKSFQEYQNRLNWDFTANLILEWCAELIPRSNIY